jgi:hypothetical protein
MSLLLLIYSSVPSSPCLQGGEHSTLSALISECSLSTSVGTTSTYSRNSGHSSTCSPTLSGVFVSLFWVYSVGLSSVFIEIGVDEVYYVKSDGSAEDCW